jgi:rubrerythrin
MKASKAGTRKKPKVSGSDRMRDSDGCKIFTCALCKESFTNICIYISHVVEHPKNEQEEDWDDDAQDILAYSCEVCNEILEDMKVLKEHLAEGHAAFQCPKCPMQFPTRDDRDVHLCNAHELWPCKVCDKAFDTEAELKVHRLEEKFPCRRCSKVLSSLAGLRSHMKLHSERQRAFVCELCKKLFRTPQLLALHKRNVHEDVPLRYQCDTCGKAFKFPEGLKSHAIIHQPTNEACPVCGKIFPNPTYLRTHMKWHSDERPHCCDMCGKRFKSMSVSSPCCTLVT